ncbi:hypothetical protein MNBD_GAMMA12-1278 [hydrothermal vent metagenome]|uniref:Uncharacterized protein n=1 Tax=hydrothermal vent metagenome TaxID=652676 RepID=A0A3B0Y6Z4_9ZZZZ
MDEQSKTRLSTIFKICYKGRCEFALGPEANLAIVDIDNNEIVWEEFIQQYPGLPVIVMSDSPVDLVGVTYVAKPAKLDLLWNSISTLADTSSSLLSNTNNSTSSSRKVHNNQATNTHASTNNSQQTQRRNNSSKQNVDAATESSRKLRTPDRAKSESTQPKSSPNLNQQQVNNNTTANAINTKLKVGNNTPNVINEHKEPDKDTVYYNMDGLLLSHLLSILKENQGTKKAIHIECWRDRSLILNPSVGQVYTDLTDSQIKYLGAVPREKQFTIKNNIKGKGNEVLSAHLNNGLQCFSIEYFLWDLALRTARGRIPEGTHLTQPQYLSRWPNFPRLPHTPHGMRMASVWVNKPYSLDQMTTKMGVAQEDVFSFYSASLSIGLMGADIQQNDVAVVEKKVVKKRGLLASILRSLVPNNH